VAVLKGVLILQRKFAMVGESEPIVIIRAYIVERAAATPLQQFSSPIQVQDPKLEMKISGKFPET
jgi:hypothetical protein